MRQRQRGHVGPSVNFGGDAIFTAELGLYFPASDDEAHYVESSRR